MEFIEKVDNSLKDTNLRLEQLYRKDRIASSQEGDYKFLFQEMGTPSAIYCVENNARDFIFSDFNTAAEQIDNISKSDVIGRNIIDVFPKTRTSGLLEAFSRVYKTGKPESFYVKLFNDGEIIGWRKNYVYQLPDKRIVAIYSSDTERHQADEQLIAHRRRLRDLTCQLSLSEERQRRKIAANLHDQLSQWLAIAAMKLGFISDSLDADTAEEIDQITETIRNAISSVRTLIYDLSSPTLYRFGLEAAVFEYATSLFKKYNEIECEFIRAKETVKLKEDINVLLFQSVRELLFNVIKYAKASHVVIDMTVSGDYYEVKVSDDGTGFDVSTIGSLNCTGGFGLFHIAERLNHLGGKLQIDSKPGKGSSFCLRIPYNSIE